MLGLTRVVALVRATIDPGYFVRLVALLDRLELLYLAVFLTAGLVVLVRALVRSRRLTVKRQLRSIVWGTALGAMPFALGYAVPFAFGVEPSLPMELSAVPLGFIPVAFASAIVRYRLMDVEIILKRLLVYTSAVAASVVIFVVILKTSGGSFIQGESDQRWVIAFLATVVVILLAKPVKDGLQRAIDRAFYRDRYDYRQALVEFARDLSSDLVLDRLAERLVTRVGETIELDAMAFLLATDRRRLRAAARLRPRKRAAAAPARLGHRQPRGVGQSGPPRRSAGRRPASRPKRSSSGGISRHLLLRAVCLEGVCGRRAACSAAGRAASR